MHARYAFPTGDIPLLRKAIALLLGQPRQVCKTSLRAIAAALNERGIPTASGTGEWQAVQVSRVLARLPAA
jgi:ABC-type hemin transport system ATPase subunit